MRSQRSHPPTCMRSNRNSKPSASCRRRQVAVLQAELSDRCADHYRSGRLGTCFVISYVTKGPEAELSLEGVDMAEYSEQIDALGADFVKTQGIEDERLVRTDASIAISENAAQDGSASLTARVSAGQINMIVAETDIFAEVNDRGDITKPAEVMSAADLEQVKDALVDAKGNPVSDVNDAVGFDLSHSKTWTSMKGLLKEGVILGFSNITESKDMPIQFVEYLQFE